MVSLRAVRFVLAVATASVALATTAVPAVAQKPAGKTAGPSAAGSAERGVAIERIAAVVNDEAITVSDVDARVRLALLSSGMAENGEARQRVLPQVLRQLVDERLELQEAKRLSISIPDKELDEAISRVAGSNRMNRAQLQQFLAQHGIPLSTMLEQTRALLAWQRVVQRRARQEVVVNEEDITAAMERAKKNIGKQEMLVSEIFLSADTPQQEEQVRRTADRLVEELRRGAQFQAIARQFSQGGGAAQGGDLGWVQPGDMGAEIDQALSNLHPGMISPAIHSANGFHILFLRAKRVVGGEEVETAPQAAPHPAQQPSERPDLNKATVQLKQIVLAAPDEAKRKEVTQTAEGLRKSIKGCAAFQAKAQEIGGQSGDMGTMKVKDMPAQLGQIVLSLAVGEPSPVLNGPSGSLILMVCKRDVPMLPSAPVAAPAAPPPPTTTSAKASATAPTRDDVETQLVAERSELLSRRYLRDLRRAAFIESRI